MQPNPSSPPSLRTADVDGAVRLINSFLDVSLTLTQQFDTQHILISIVERSMSLTSARYGAAVLVGPDGKMAEFLHRGLTREEVARLPHLPRGEGLLGWVLERRETLRLEDMSEHPASVGFPYDHVGMQALLAVPMLFRGRMIGALYLSKPPGDSPFDEVDEALVKALAAMAALGVENARLFAAETERASRSSVLRAVSDAVHSSLEMDSILTSTAEKLGKAARSDRCVIRLARPGTPGSLEETPHQWHASGLDPLPPGDLDRYPVSALAAVTRTTQRSDDLASDPVTESSGGEFLGGRAALATPLLWGDELLGVALLKSESPRTWTQAEIQLIEEAAAIVSAGLHHARKYADALATVERLQELDQMRSDFVTMVSHEVRSPATAIAGIADILKRHEDLDAERRAELLETLGRESRRLARLVSSVLDVEALDQGALSLDITTVDLAQLAHEAVLDARALQKTRVVAEPGNPVVAADRDKVKQVLINLLNNALRFSPDGEFVSIAVTPGTDEVIASVTDKGPGIPEAHRSKIFKRFGTVPGVKRGSGMGLYLSRKLVEAHGGAIWFETGDRGTTFSFKIPRRETIPGEESA